MGEFVDDPRHRFSYELRPDQLLDAAIRGLAAALERDGLLPAGASTAPRFQPHLTLARASRADRAAVDAIAATIESSALFELDRAGSFGDGRIAWLAPAPDSRLRVVRAILVEQLGVDQVDPLALARDPWIPHVTIAYSIDEQHRAEAARRVAEALPLAGAWRSVECWDLDVRPTRRVHRALIVPRDRGDMA